MYKYVLKDGKKCAAVVIMCLYTPCLGATSSDYVAGSRQFESNSCALGNIITWMLRDKAWHSHMLHTFHDMWILGMAACLILSNKVSITEVIANIFNLAMEIVPSKCEELVRFSLHIALCLLIFYILTRKKLIRQQMRYFGTHCVLNRAC